MSAAGTTPAPGVAAFEFAAPARIRFGEGTARETATLVGGLGRRALLVTGASAHAAAVGDRLADAGLTRHVVRVAGEPTVAEVERAVADARAASCDVVAAVGGGSVIDAGKAIAALLTNRGELRSYLEVVGEGRALAERAAPCVAIPTTAGTGAEVTRNAVLTVEGSRMKVSLRSPLMLPALALVDPELTYSLPPALTASTGLDALTQCVEPLVTPAATPLSDAVAREGLRRAAGALRRAVDDGTDAGARRDMALASLCGGLALANARLGAVHGFAAPLGGMFPIPHGVACARLLAPVVAANVHALRARAPGAPALARYDEIARTLTGHASARAEDAAPWLAVLVDALAVPRLSTYRVTPADVPAISAAARRASSMQGNPVALTDEELEDALSQAL